MAKKIASKDFKDHSVKVMAEEKQEGKGTILNSPSPRSSLEDWDVGSSGLPWEPLPWL